MCDLVGMKQLSVEDVDVANLALDAIEDARARARRGR